jgi:hypothetical protein
VAVDYTRTHHPSQEVVEVVVDDATLGEGHTLALEEEGSPTGEKDNRVERTDDRDDAWVHTALALRTVLSRALLALVAEVVEAASFPLAVEAYRWVVGDAKAAVATWDDLDMDRPPEEAEGHRSDNMCVDVAAAPWRGVGQLFLPTDLHVALRN